MYEYDFIMLIRVDSSKVHNQLNTWCKLAAGATL